MEKIVKEFVNDYNSGKKKALNDILLFKKEFIQKTLDVGFSVNATKRILEEKLQISININTFYRWIQKNITKKSSKKTANNTKKTYTENVTNIKEEKTKNECDDIRIMPNFYPESAEYQ